MPVNCCPLFLRWSKSFFGIFLTCCRPSFTASKNNCAKPYSHSPKLSTDRHTYSLQKDLQTRFFIVMIYSIHPNTLPLGEIKMIRYGGGVDIRGGGKVDIQFKEGRYWRDLHYLNKKRKEWWHGTRRDTVFRGLVLSFLLHFRFNLFNSHEGTFILYL